MSLRIFSSESHSGVFRYEETPKFEPLLRGEDV